MFELLRADSLPVNRCLCELVMLRKASLAPWFGAPFQRLLLPLSCSSSGMARGDHSKVRAGGLIDGVKRRVVVEMGVANVGGAYGPWKATLFVTLVRGSTQRAPKQQWIESPLAPPHTR